MGDSDQNSPDTSRHDQRGDQMPTEHAPDGRYHESPSRTRGNGVRPIHSGGDDKQKGHSPEGCQHTWRHEKFPSFLKRAQMQRFNQKKG
jgi:hypothetical protein